MKAKLALLRLLTRRDLSAAQARQKLIEREFSPQEAAAAVAECQTAGYLDDRRWAEGRVRALVRKRKGNSYIRQKLAQEGLSKELIEASLPTEETQAEALARLFEARYATRDLSDPKVRQKTVQALQRQGFPLSLILNSPEIANYS